MKYAVMGLLGIHGVIHVMGFMGAWGLAKFEGASPVPTQVIHASMGDPVVKVLGLVWLLAVAAFVGAAVLLAMDLSAWRAMALGAALVSMTVIALWWPDARMGAVANALVVVAVALGPRLGLAA